MSHAKQRFIGAGQFKAQCLQLMDQVNQQGIELVITKRGRPVAKLVPPDQADRGHAIGWLADHTVVVGNIIAPDQDVWESSGGSDPA